MRLCFIPARGGSKRIPRKNVRSLGGKPLLAWTIECAQKSACFGDIVVSSDDAEILEVARSWGAIADRRPDALASDQVRFVEVLEEFLLREANVARYSEVAVLLPTCPFRAVEDILNGLRLRESQPEAFVVSISPYEFPPDFACDFEPNSSALRLRRPEVYLQSTQSQSRPAAFHPNGSLFVASVEGFLETRSFYSEPLLGSLIPNERAFDLDHPHQWEMAECLARTRLNS